MEPEQNETSGFFKQNKNQSFKMIPYVKLDETLLKRKRIIIIIIFTPLFFLYPNNKGLAALKVEGTIPFEVIITK